MLVVSSGAQELLWIQVLHLPHAEKQEALGGRAEGPPALAR